MTWTLIDTVEDGGMPIQNTVSCSYETDVQEVFQYYKLTIEKNSYVGEGTKNGLQLAEISMFGNLMPLTDAF